jgi:15-cis-phytoene synthase/lycopene beta-cyclase
VAFGLYEENREAIEKLPEYARGGIRVAVESYIEIGRVMNEKMAKGEKLDMDGGGKEGRASVPRARRLWVGWTTIAGPRSC